MGRTIYAEKPLRTYLASVAKPDGYVIGLILGQVRLFFLFFSVALTMFNFLTYVRRVQCMRNKQCTFFSSYSLQIIEI